MGLKERVYSVLVVSQAERFNTAIKELLAALPFEPVYVVSSVNAAERMTAERSFDCVLINFPLPDDPGLRFSVQSCANRETVTLLLVRSELYEQVYDRVAEHGVFTLAKPAPKAAVLQALNWMVSARERLRKVNNKIQPLEKRMEEIQLVNRAKWLLVSRLSMSEPDAHHYIEHQAMNRCVSKGNVAQEIISLYS